MCQRHQNGEGHESKPGCVLDHAASDFQGHLENYVNAGESIGQG